MKAMLRLLSVLLLLSLACRDAGTPDARSTAGRARPDLTGEIHARAGGAIPATIYIATATPKKGTSTFCPSCYVDCGKRARTDSKGRFRIESLDPDLRFQILVAAPGYRPASVASVDPARGSLKVELLPTPSWATAPDHCLRGRVVDTSGAPIEAAVLEVEGVGRMWGLPPGVDPLTVTDERGEFLLGARDSFDIMAVCVTAGGFADRRFTNLQSGSVPHELVMSEGAALTGRVLRDGKPLGGVSVGVSGVNREAGAFVGHFEIGTDADGAFTFVDLPPDADYYIYGLMETFKGAGAVPLKRVHSGKDGETTSAGDLVVRPGHRLAGTVVLADGKRLPRKTRLLVGRQDAWDTVELVIGKDGSFEVTDIPPDEAIELVLQVRGYHLSPRNENRDWMNMGLVGRVDRDITNLVVLFDKGEERPASGYRTGLESEWPQNRPLRGAEAPAGPS